MAISACGFLCGFSAKVTSGINRLCAEIEEEIRNDPNADLSVGSKNIFKKFQEQGQVLPPKKNLPENSPENSKTFFDKTQKAVGNVITNFSENIDQLFGGERYEQSGSETHLRLTTKTTISEGFTPDNDIEIKARLNLPRLKDRLSLVIDSASEEEVGYSSNTSPLTNNKSGENESGFFASIQYLLLGEKGFDIKTDIGIKVRPPVDPFVRFRARKSFFMDNWEFRITESFFQYLQEGFEHESKLDFESPFGSELLFLFSNIATWEESDQFWTFNHFITFFQPLTDDFAFSYAIGLESTSQNSIAVQQYIAAVTFRKRMFRDWFFFEVTPGISYPRELGFDQALFVTIGFETIFGENPGEDKSPVGVVPK